MSMKVLETLKILPSSPTSLLSPLALSRALPLATGRDVNKRHSLRRGISATMGSYYFYSVWDHSYITSALVGGGVRKCPRLFNTSIHKLVKI